MQIDRSLLKMKLNLTNEKLTRLLLSANPVLANCKGSVKAVRLFMNMLGLKCALNVSGMGAIFTFKNLGKTPSYSNMREAITNGTQTSAYFSYICMDTNHTGLLFARSKDYTNYNLFSIKISEPNNENISTLYVYPCTADEIEEWNHSVPDEMKIQLSDNFAERQRYTLLALNDIIKNFRTYQERIGVFPGTEIRDSYTLVPALNNTADDSVKDLVICVTNVTDKNLQPIKAVLTKQLQEILPINMIVTEDHIIGCANE